MELDNLLLHNNNAYILDNIEIIFNEQTDANTLTDTIHCSITAKNNICCNTCEGIKPSTFSSGLCSRPYVTITEVPDKDTFFCSEYIKLGTFGEPYDWGKKLNCTKD